MSSPYELFHYSIFPGVVVGLSGSGWVEFGAEVGYMMVGLGYGGLSFSQVANQLTGQLDLSALVPMGYHIAGVGATHEGSLLSWCWNPWAFGVFCSCSKGKGNVRSTTKVNHILTIAFSYRPTTTFIMPATSSEPSVIFLRCLLQPTTLYLPFLELSYGKKHHTIGNASYSRVGRLWELASKERFGVACELAVIVWLASWVWRTTTTTNRFMGWGVALWFAIELSGISDPFVVGSGGVLIAPLAASNPVTLDPVSSIHQPSIYMA